MRCRIVLWLALFGTELFLLTAAEPNLTLGKPVEASGPTWAGLVPAGLTDGNPNTFSHPLDATGTFGFYYQIDLGRSVQFDRILLRNRSDGCCPERLTDYRIEIYGDAGGETGSLNWSADVRTDGSHSGPSGIDTIRGNLSPAGTFTGRFVRIMNNSGGPYNPQIAEVEVYRGMPPQIHFFAADDDTISAGGIATLRWEISGATSAAIDPGGIVLSTTNGAISVTPASTTVYTLTATNAAGSSSATVRIGVDVTLVPPLIHEFVADNDGGLKDEDGDSPDWIELVNPNPYTLELLGYAISDDPQLPRKWQLPAARMPPHGFLVVFASGKDRRNTESELHTNFGLDADGDYLGLSDASGLIVQQFPTNYPVAGEFPAQLENVSYGTGANAILGYLRPVTPGQSNGVAFPGIVATPRFSLQRGFFTNDQALAITSDTPGAVIRYTISRAEPSATQGFIYTGPIPITRNTIVRAAAFRDGWAPTEVTTHTYLFPSNVVASAVMRTNITQNPIYAPKLHQGLLDIPSMSLVTTGNINDTTEIRASLEWLRPDGLTGFQENCGVRYFGGAFTAFAKKNFRIYFRSDYGAAKLEYPLFAGHEKDIPAVDEFDQLELRGGSHDMVDRGFYMANIFTDDTLLEMGQLNPHGRFIHLYLNGTYWGLFHLRERWGAAMHESYLGGARTNYESINGNWNVGGWAEPGSPYDGDGSAWEKVKSLRADYAAIKPLLDVPQYIDYMLMWMFGGAEDEYRCVGPTAAGSGFKFYLNDADGWFCGPWYCAAGDRTIRNSPGRAAGDGPGSIFSMLFAEGHKDYRVLLADRIYRSLFNSGALTPGPNRTRLSARCAEIERAFLAESARWNYLTPNEWANRRDHSLTNWLARRTAEALAQFRAAGFYPALDAPVLNQQGGSVPAGFQVRFLGPSPGAIHFTLDGSDPRLPGGAISPAARTYSTGSLVETVVPVGSRWRWFTDANGLGRSDIVEGHAQWSASNWKHPDFDDASWSEGPAQLGYGEQDEATPIPFGPDPENKWRTVYFRQRFVISQTNEITGLRLRLKRDDGAIVYLNGRDTARSGITTGPVNATTFADPASDDGQTFHEISLSPAFLRPGTNLIAVELHQATLNSSDLSFDLELAALRSNAQSGEETLPILTANTVIKCRAQDGADWSALNETFFQVGPSAIEPGEIVVSEFRYDSTRASSEFIELRNVSSRAVNLRGAAFFQGIDYKFLTQRDTLLAPGQRLVLVSDLFRFQRSYGIEVPVAGIYFGSLATGGERLTLGTSSNVLTSFSYQTGAPWPAEVGARTATLVLSHPELGLDHPAAWRASAEPSGTPGGSDSSAFTGTPTADLDNDGVVALLEYAFGTSDSDPASGPDAVRASVDVFGNLALTFPRNLRADDVLIQCQKSLDLNVWSLAVLLGSEIAEAGLAHETWGVPAAGNSAVFLRLRALHN